MNTGDWVMTANGSKRLIGFILEFSRLRNEAYIMQVSVYANKRIIMIEPFMEAVESRHLMAVGITLAKEDWDAMIDMAIWLDDERWFRELSERRPF